MTVLQIFFIFESEHMSALIKMQTGYIWLLSDGESALEDKETMKSLLNEADWVGIGSRKYGEKDVVELEFWFELEMSERGMQNERAGKSGENRAETV